MKPVAYSWEMAIDLSAAPPPPEWPEGVSLRTRGPGDEREFYRARCEAFRDHRGFADEPFEEGFARWLHIMQSEEYYDPALWFRAMSAGHTAGFVIGKPGAVEDPEKAWVDYLGVLRPHRCRGLGLALLRHIFGEFYRRGISRAGLVVDADSQTGATRLYEKAGMHVVRQHTAYEKELRSGIELRTQSLET